MAAYFASERQAAGTRGSARAASAQSLGNSDLAIAAARGQSLCDGDTQLRGSRDAYTRGGPAQRVAAEFSQPKLLQLRVETEILRVTHVVGMAMFQSKGRRASDARQQRQQTAAGRILDISTAMTNPTVPAGKSEPTQTARSCRRQDGPGTPTTVPRGLAGQFATARSRKKK